MLFKIFNFVHVWDEISPLALPCRMGPGHVTVVALCCSPLDRDVPLRRVVHGRLPGVAGVRGEGFPLARAIVGEDRQRRHRGAAAEWVTHSIPQTPRDFPR